LNARELLSLDGRVALVTGASRGIGLAIARALASAGAMVVVNGREADRLGPAVEAIEGEGGRAEAMAFDVRDAAAATDAVAAIVGRHGRLDILVSNVGGGVRKPLAEHSDADFMAAIAGNLLAAFRLAREAAGPMSKAGFGRILVISSINGTVARPGMAGYAAAKAGLNGLVRALAVELAPAGICVNALAPGYFPTEANAPLRAENPDLVAKINGRTPMGRWGALEELGAAAVFLSSPGASYCTGQVLAVDGGLLASL
jgi:gluconate 5-dehydrogenase